MGRGTTMARLNQKRGNSKFSACSAGVNLGPSANVIINHHVLLVIAAGAESSCGACPEHMVLSLG